MGFDFVEKQIRLAQERGDFDNLPGAGKPIEGLGDRYDPNWWARDFTQRQSAENADRQTTAALENRLARVWGMESERSVREAVDDLNREAGSDLFDADPVIATWRKFRFPIRPDRGQAKTLPGDQ